jgi:predicted dehydrogenase
MANPVALALIGAGNRGTHAYATYAKAFPQEVRFVAVAEPDPVRRNYFAHEHDLGPDQCFESWDELLDRPQFAEGVLVTTQDQMHVAPALTAMERGYHVLLEKPMADSLEGCVRLVQTAERTGRTLQIGHVLRYAPFFQALHQVLAEERLGDLITVEHRENVSFWHMAHAWVRGNWRNETLSTPMILSKCCHDLDILHWNLNQSIQRVSSVGSLIHFRPEQAGPEIPDRCTDGCPIEADCAYSAIGIYLEMRPFKQAAARHGVPFTIDQENPRTWPFLAISQDTSSSARRHALETGPYGRCVYRSDNDVVDHQLVTMETETGASVVLAMHGHAYEESRSMRYDGTKATLRGIFSGAKSEIVLCTHARGIEERIPVGSTNMGGHGGGDWRLMQSFIAAIRGESEPLTTARASLESHLLGFAAEEARKTYRVVDMGEFRTRAERLAN